MTWNLEITKAGSRQGISERHEGVEADIMQATVNHSGDNVPYLGTVLQLKNRAGECVGTLAIRELYPTETGILADGERAMLLARDSGDHAFVSPGDDSVEFWALQKPTGVEAQ
jgi:hypothetical protein